MMIVHLTASRFFGGPERQMLELGLTLRGACDSTFITFSEDGHCQHFLAKVREAQFDGVALLHDTPHLRTVVREIAALLHAKGAAIVCCHGYKASLLGRIAARRVGIPAVAVARGWTAESLRVRLYEALDRLNLRWMDHVVCVSEGQAAKVRRAGVAADKISVIHNAIRTDRFRQPASSYRSQLHALFPSPPKLVVGAAGRLSPEKGFGNLIDAAKPLLDEIPNLGFVLFGDGPLRSLYGATLRQMGIANRFLLPGFRSDLDGFFAFFDLLVLPSFTEGLPNVVLEAMAAGVPVVATAVGGTPEVVRDGQTGFLVPSGDASVLTRRIRHLLADDQLRTQFGREGQLRVQTQFTFAAQGHAYRRLFARLGIRFRRDEASPEFGRLAGV